MRCSATPKNYKDAYLIEIPEEDVIAEGLIKKLLLINENFEQNISVDDQVSYLMDKALTKRRKIHSEFLKRKVEVNPLIVVQLPNKSDVLLDSIETYLSAQGITYENEKFTENVKRSLGKGALEERDLTLKREYSHFTLICQQKTNVPFPRDAKLALKVIKKYFANQYNLDDKAVKNGKKLEAYKYDFNTDVIDYTKSGELATLSKEEFDNLNEIKIREKLTTHKHGKEYHHCVAEIGMKVGLDYNSIYHRT